MKSNRSTDAHAAYADFPVRQRRVGKSGAVCIPGFPQGVKVRIVSLGSQTHVVSLRPENEVRDIAMAIPRASASPFGALTASLSSRKRVVDAPRPRREYMGPTLQPQPASEILAEADVRRTRRVR